MNPAIVIAVVVCVASAVDPGAARAIATKNARLLDEADAALLSGDAAQALERALSIDDSDRRLDRRRFLRLRARSRLALGVLADGADDLDAARALRNDTDGAVDDPERARRHDDDRLLARARRDLGHFDRCADVFLAAPMSGAIDDDDALLVATCLRATTRRALAHDVLAGRRRNDVVTLRARVRLEDGLVRLARDDVAAIVDNAGDGAIDNGALAEFAAAFAAAGDRVFAQRLRDVVTARAGRAPPPPPARARLLLEDRERLRARLRALVDASAWEELRALHPRVRAAGYLDDDDVRYAVAWALVVTGDVDGADRVLDGVTGAAAFERATGLRAVIDRCRREGGDACPR